MISSTPFSIIGVYFPPDWYSPETYIYYKQVLVHLHLKKNGLILMNFWYTVWPSFLQVFALWLNVRYFKYSYLYSI